MNEGVSLLDLNTEVLLELTLWRVINNACCWLIWWICVICYGCLKRCMYIA